MWQSLNYTQLVRVNNYTLKGEKGKTIMPKSKFNKYVNILPMDWEILHYDENVQELINAWRVWVSGCIGKLVEVHDENT